MAASKLSIAAKERWRKRKADMEVSHNEVSILCPCFYATIFQTLYLFFYRFSFSEVFFFLCVYLKEDQNIQKASLASQNEV